jgi:hypothetical protein
MSDAPTHDYKRLRAPWPEGPSIFEVIRAAGDAAGEIDLPDADIDGETRWAPGARDGVATSGGGFEDETLRAKQVVKALRDLLNSGTQADLDHLHRLVTRGPILGIMDQVLGDIVAGDWISPQNLHGLASFLARSATERELVKLSAGILGILSGSNDLELLMTLGRHEEFTLYVAVAIQATREDADEQLFRLAQTVGGWGRIHVVERLAESENPEVHAWLLREGFRSEIMDVYLALLCARVADLAGALERPVLDETLLEGAAEILFALCEGSPDEDIDDYPDAALACQRYVEGLRENEEWWSAVHLRALTRISALLVEGQVIGIEAAAAGIEVDSEYLWAQRLEQGGWTLERRETIEAHCSALLEQDRWSAIVEVGLASESRSEYLLALSGADALGIDTRETDEARLRAEPTWLGGWHRYAEIRQDARRMLELFREAVSTEELGAGADLRYDFDEKTTLEDALAVVLESSGGTSERPWDLLELGLRSPWVRVRATAINAFDSWIDSGSIGRSVDEARAFILEFAEGEPSEELTQMLQASASSLDE